METNHTWEQLYKAAVLETDNGKLPQLIDQARTAINARVKELSMDGNNPSELQALEQALQSLKVVHQERCSGSGL